MKRVILWMGAVCAWGQVEAPVIGTMIDAAGKPRRVYGVAGNFTLGPPLEEAVLDSLPSTAGAAVSVSGGEVIMRRPDASEVRFTVAGVTGWRAMSAEWVQVITSGGMFALYLERGREALFVLPAPRAEARRR